MARSPRGAPSCFKRKRPDGIAEIVRILRGSSAAGPDRAMHRVDAGPVKAYVLLILCIAIPGGPT
jgi:hypothetical protein